MNSFWPYSLAGLGTPSHNMWLFYMAFGDIDPCK